MFRQTAWVGGPDIRRSRSIVQENTKQKDIDTYVVRRIRTHDPQCLNRARQHADSSTTIQDNSKRS